MEKCHGPSIPGIIPLNIAAEEMMQGDLAESQPIERPQSTCHLSAGEYQQRQQIP
jgi:hypothetical protein